jgi:hypothetical protein
MQHEQQYRELLAELRQSQDQLRRRDVRYSWLRGISMMAALAGVVAWVLEHDGWYAVLAFGMIAVFLISVRRQSSLRQNLVDVKRQIQLVTEELDYLLGAFSHRSNGAEFAQADHPYAFDLDVVGTGSLYHRVNRTATRDAQSRLADVLLNPSWTDVGARQRCVEHLKPQWRASLKWRAKASALDDTATLVQLEGWLSEAADLPRWQHPLVLALLALLLPVLIVFNALNVLMVEPGVFTVLVLFNLTLLGVSLKQIKRHRHWISGLNGQIRAYLRVLEETHELDLTTDQLKPIEERIIMVGSEKSSPLVALQKLSRTLSQLDALDNVLGAAMLNGICLFHLFVFRTAIKWRQTHGAQLREWLRDVHELEVWLSLAQYAQHHSEFSYAEVRTGAGYEAEALAHPFLSEQQRVANDLELNHRPIKILTGSNMSGKSTFLRSVGLSVVMTAAGLPVCAKRATMEHLLVLTSMRPQDSVLEDRSYFQAEIMRLRMLREAMLGGEKCLVLFDEILRGTNSVDKRNGTMGFLQKIKAYSVIGVAATHDVEIAHAAIESPEKFEAMFFESIHVDGELKFDYTLRKGVCQEPNASELLKKYGLI